MLIPLSWWRGVRVAGLMLAVGQVFASDMPAVITNAPATGMQPPVEVAAALPTVRLLGRGILRFFGLAVYEARLWVGADFVPGRYDAHAFALELQYLRKLDGASIAQRSIAEMRRAGSFGEAQAESWLDAMTHAFPDVVPGDRLTGVYLPAGTTRFHHNGQPTSAVTDPDFGRLFFGIWLAGNTSEPALRRQLIGPGS